MTDSSCLLDVRADDIGGYTIPADSSVVICPYVTHRHPDFWQNAGDFDPDRFLPERDVPHGAYLPFGVGQRLCIGSNFAMMEGVLICAMVLQRFRLELVPGFRVEPKPCITLRTRQGVVMTLHPWPTSRVPSASTEAATTEGEAS